MAFWNSLINGLKSKNTGNTANVVPNVLVNGQPATQIDPQTAPAPMTASVNQDVNATPQNTGNVQQNPQATAQKQNAIINALKNIAPTNWDDTTRQRVLLASKFLTGFGGTPYNPNGDFLSNLAQGVTNGANSAYKQMENYQNYQNTKALYNQLGLDSSGLNPVGDYSSMTPAQVISLGIRQQQNAIRNEIANANDKTKRLNLIMNGYNKGSISADEAQKLMQMYGLDINDLQESNETKRTNSQIEVNSARKKQIEASIRQNDQKIAILKQKVAQGKAGQADKDLLNKLNIENKKLIIEQNRLINEGLKDQLGNGGDKENGGGGGGRPVGQRNNVKVF